MPRSRDPRRDTHLAKATDAMSGYFDQQPDPVLARALFSTGYIAGWDDLAALTQTPSPKPRGDRR
jgi:hypothetical protein